ncbi:Uncharacterised protein [Serratia ficaria]|nr:Uncharacterised protein [Serratia ficaria]
MRIHLPIQPVQWIERNGAAAAVEEGDARMPGPLAAPPDRRQIGCMLGKHELGVPLPFVLAGVIDTRKPAEVAIERGDFVLFTHRLQASIEQDIAELEPAPVEICQVATAQIERQ